jgi:hypothetical protein
MSYRNVEGEGQNKADSEGDRHHVVNTLGSEHLRSESTPRDSICCRGMSTYFRTVVRKRTVVTLSVLSRPQTCTRDRQQSYQWYGIFSLHRRHVQPEYVPGRWLLIIDNIMTSIKYTISQDVRDRAQTLTVQDRSDHSPCYRLSINLKICSHRDVPNICTRKVTLGASLTYCPSFKS